MTFLIEFIEQIIMVECDLLEQKLRTLTTEGCTCGNRDIRQYTLIYCEHRFKYIKCERCGKRHTPIIMMDW